MSDSEQAQLAELSALVNEVLLRQKLLDARLQTVEHTLKLSQPAAPEPVMPQVAAAEPVRVEPPITFLSAAVESSGAKSQAEGVWREEPEPLSIEHPAPPALETRVGLTIINRVGAVTLVLGVAFFFKWAVDNNWIGPVGRVGLGLLAGFAALTLADFLWRKAQQVFAQGITGTGIAIVYVAFYAALEFYHLVPQVIAFLLLLGTTVLATGLALRYASIAIALLGLFGAYLIPLLLSNGQDHPWFLICYLLTINFAAQRLAMARSWRLLELFSFFGTLFIFGVWILRFGYRPEDHGAAVIGLLALYAQRFQTSWPVLFLWMQIFAALGLEFASHARPDFILFSPLMAATGLAFSHLRRYGAVVPIAFAFFWFNALSWQSSSGHSSSLLAFIGFALFTAWVWWRSGDAEGTPTTARLPIFALNGVFFYAIAYMSLHATYKEWMGLLAIAVGSAYLAFGLLRYRRTRAENDTLTLLSLGMAAAFVVLAIPIQLSGFSICTAWAIMGAALTWLARRFERPGVAIAGLSVFVLAAVELLSLSASPHQEAHALLINSRFFSFATVSIALLLSAYWVEKIETLFARIEFIAGHVVLLAGLTLETLDWAHSYARPENQLSVETISTTILFALYAIALVSAGVATRSYFSRIAGLVLTAIVIAKLYIFDVWQMSRVYQIIAFVILGVLLLSTSFLYSRFKDVIAEWAVKETR